MNILSWFQKKGELPKLQKAFQEEVYFLGVHPFAPEYRMLFDSGMQDVPEERLPFRHFVPYHFAPLLKLLALTNNLNPLSRFDPEHYKEQKDLPENKLIRSRRPLLSEAELLGTADEPTEGFKKAVSLLKELVGVEE